MSQVSYIISGQGTINVVLLGMGKHFTIPTSHPYYDELYDAVLAKDADTILELADKASAVEKYTQGKVTVDAEQGVVLYKDKPLHNTITARIVSMLREGHPFSFMVTFLENVMQNPSKSSVDSLYDFLAHVGLPITEDGHFLAYKGVSSNFMDLHTRTINNSVGQVVEVERNEVDDDREVGCSMGLHAGTYEYASNYAGPTNAVVLVKINPKDVVSVPHDCNHQKLRTCRYEVLEVYKAAEPIQETLFFVNYDEDEDDEWDEVEEDEYESSFLD